MSLKWISFPSPLALSLILVISSGVGARAQSESETKAAKTEAPALPSTATLPKTYPVVTAKGSCPKSAATSKNSAKAECKVTLGRENFESLVNGINPKMVKGERRVLASTYGKALALAEEASRRGLDRDPRLQAQIQYSRLILLANAMSKELYKESLKSTDEDAEKYYASHGSLFERFTFDRIFVPLEKHSASPLKSSDVEVTSGQANDLKQKEMKELAEQVYARAVAGEDFGKLQNEVFKTAEIATEPNIKVEDLRRGDLSQVQNVIFDLQPGKISALLTDDTGYFIYKMVSRIVPPFQEVKPQVTVRMQIDNNAEAVRKIEKMSNAQVNDNYFDKYDPPPPSEEEVELDSD
jgi:parvulin-like peptidyl-prolyl cis-trans isomerase-like protein